GDVFGGGDFNINFAVNVGDVNGDGTVDFVDFTPVLAATGSTAAGGSPYSVFADQNFDGTIDFVDFTPILGNTGNMVPASFPGALSGLSPEGEGSDEADGESYESSVDVALGDFFN
ncbi:MAG: hypothetical protein KDB22_07510, partial [Planctomycetales bacterium]|nr:hypothetical protein [Planctomycetales bacterium]